MPPKIKPALVNQLLAPYQIQVDRFLPWQKGYRNYFLPLVTNHGQTLALGFFKPEANNVALLKRTNLVSSWLASQGFPTRQPVLTTTGQSLIGQLSTSQAHHPRLVCLYNYLPGQTIPWASYSQKHLKLTGQVLSHLHAALRHFPINQSQLFPAAVPQLASSWQTAVNYWQRPAVSSALKQKLNLSWNWPKIDQLTKLFSALTVLPGQLLHLDLVRSNILFDSRPAKVSPAAVSSWPAAYLDPRFGLTPSPAAKHSNQILVVSGLIDLEKMAHGPIILDLARTLAFLLVDCPTKTDHQINQYFLFSGYQKRGSTSLPTLELLPSCLNLFWALDAYHFLHANPYESLPQNQHWLATRQRLISSQLLIATN